MYEETRTHKTGYCSVGHHEGGRYPGPSGKLNKTCTFIETCSCDDPKCHKMFDAMFEASGMDRVPVDNSGYSPDRHNFVMPLHEIVEASPVLSTQTVDLPPDTLESVAPGQLPPVKRTEWHITPSGRAGRGQLEDQINRVCIGWLADESPAPCTPKLISEEIAKAEGIKAPSVGAIDAAFKRWERYGYAVIARHPTRFVRFTKIGIERGLDWLKAHPQPIGGTHD